MVLVPVWFGVPAGSPNSPRTPRYRDLRLSIGLQCVDGKGHHAALEIAYLFNRRLEYTSGIGDYHLNDTALIRIVQTY